MKIVNKDWNVNLSKEESIAISDEIFNVIGDHSLSYPYLMKLLKIINEIKKEMNII